MTIIHRTALFVGVSLAAAGIVMLVGLGNAAAGDVIGQAARLWPLAIIALGAGLLVRGTRYALVGTLVAATLAGLVVGGAVVAAPDLNALCGDGVASNAPTQNGTFTGRATVELTLDCGDLQVTTIDGSGWELSSLADGNAAPSVDASGDSLFVRSSNKRWYRGFDRTGDDWQIALPTDVTVDLRAIVNAGRGRFDLRDATIGELLVEANAGDARLDLTDATVAELIVEVNAGSATVLLPSGADLVGDVSASAGEIVICVPAGLGVRIHDSLDLDRIAGDSGSVGDRVLSRIAADILADVETETGANQFNGLVRVGDAWETPDLSTATHLAELTVSAQAGSVVVNPAGGCK